MKKLILFLILGLLLTFAVGCSDSEKTTETISKNTNEPTYVVQSFIKAVNNYEYTTTYDLFTVKFQEQYSMISDFINQLKIYDKIDIEKAENSPDVAKISSDKAGIWYKYDTKDFVYYELVKENGEWKISSLKLWSQDKDGNPDNFSFEN